DPATGVVRNVATRPRPVTRAGAAALGSYVYLVGGRGALQGTQTSQVYAIDPRGGRVARAGRLPVSLSDAGVTAFAGPLPGVVRQFSVGMLPQHVVPAYDLRTLWVTNDLGNSLTPINPATGSPGQPVSVEDPYNMYFTPDGRYAVVMAERLQRIDFRDAHTMALHHSLSVPQCPGVNHAAY